MENPCNKNAPQMRHDLRQDQIFYRAVENVYKCGPRAIAEAIREVGAAHMVQTSLEAKFIEFSEKLDPDIVKSVGANSFPSTPISIIKGKI